MSSYDIGVGKSIMFFKAILVFQKYTLNVCYVQLYIPAKIKKTCLSSAIILPNFKIKFI